MLLGAPIADWNCLFQSYVIPGSNPKNTIYTFMESFVIVIALRNGRK